MELGDCAGSALSSIVAIGGGVDNSIFTPVVAVSSDAKNPARRRHQSQSAISPCYQARRYPKETALTGNSRAGVPGPPSRVPSSRALLPRPGHRPAPLRTNGSAAWAPPSFSANQWRRVAGTALIRRGPIPAWPGAVAAPVGRGGGEVATGSAPLPSDPVSSLSVFLFQTTWTRRGCGRQPQPPPSVSPPPPPPGSRVPRLSEVAALGLLTSLRRARTWRLRRTPSATRAGAPSKSERFGPETTTRASEVTWCERLAAWARGLRGDRADALGARAALAGGSASCERVGEGRWRVASKAEGARTVGEAGSAPEGSAQLHAALRVYGALVVNSCTFSSFTCSNKSLASPPRFSSVPLALAINLSKEKNSLLDKNMVNEPRERHWERKVPRVGSLPCLKAGLRSSCPLGHRLFLSP
ncbi:hypothetical protein H8959_012505 [Pygathrix nigripes]